MTKNRKCRLKREFVPWRFKRHRSSFNLSNVGEFSGLESERTISKVAFTYSTLHALSLTETVSCRNRATTAKKYTKKRDARAKLSFCHNKPIAFLPLLLPSPSSLLKLRIVVIKRFFYHGNVTSYFSPLYKCRALEFYKLKSNVISSVVGRKLMSWQHCLT